MHHTLEFNMVKNVRSQPLFGHNRSLQSFTFDDWRKLARLLVLVCSVYNQLIRLFFKTFPTYTFFCEKLNVVTVLDGVRHDTSTDSAIQYY